MVMAYSNKEYYQKNKERLKAKSLATYHRQTKEMNEMVHATRMERYKEQMELAKLRHSDILIEEEEKYRHCGSCNHHYYQHHRQYIQENGDIYKEVECGYCDNIETTPLPY